MPADINANQNEHPEHDDPEHEIYDDDLQMISAFLDDQLSPEQKVAFKKRLLKEPKLNAQCRRFAALDAEVKAASSSINDTPMPEKLTKLLAKDDPNQLSVGRMLQWAAVVAAVGLLSWYDFNTSESIVEPAGYVVDNATSQALSQQPSMQVTNLDEYRQFIVLQSFYHPTGMACREYNLNDPKHKSHAVACYSEGNWRRMIDHKQTLNQTDSYQTASDKPQDPISDYLLRTAFSLPLSTKQETKMIESNWQANE